MANENDAERDIKLTIGLVLGVLVVLVGGGYFLWSWMGTPEAPPSQIDLNRVGASSRGGNTESPAYRELLRLSNEKGKATAQRENTSFIASMQMEQEPVDDLPVSTAKKTVAPVQSTARQSASGQSSGESSSNVGDKDGDRKQALTKLLNRITGTDAGGLKVGQVLGGGASGDAGGGYQVWSDSLPGGQRLKATAFSSVAGGAASVTPPVEIVPPYWRGPGIIDVGVDSDNSTTPVLGKLSTGPYAGAILNASEGAKLAGDGVVIHFTQMAFRGVNYKIDAYALQDDTLLANVATDVDHRYMSRIILPSFLSAIGGVGEMYKEANTEVLSNGFTTQTVRPGMPDGGAVIGAVVGGGAAQAGKVLSEDAARRPAKQVTVTKGQVVAIQFMRGVYSGDAIAPGQGGEAVAPAIPSQSSRSAYVQPNTEDHLRAQAQARIEQQRLLQESK
ncbi:traO protein [Pseudomonas sp. MWU12-2115]|uniref:conjugal transfer protein TraO n=1 Tax=unclassified Pseudomonas TaxID=196821 RepID=UPI000DD51200|nr:conjugal transfer protein TraO [Pseudomonas sp. MWU12-2020]RBB97351.1 traO protein [Pseudomonas sp. MWU12-2115]